MESVGALRREGLSGLAAQAGLGLRTLHFYRAKIGDGARPGKLRVVKGGKVGCRGGELRERHDEKDQVPQCGSNQGATGNAGLNAAIPKQASPQKILGNSGPGEDGPQAAASALMKTSPGEVQFRCLRTRGS